MIAVILAPGRVPQHRIGCGGAAMAMEVPDGSILARLSDRF
jgi:hypothetical protein